jgi:hypothetical protein
MKRIFGGCCEDLESAASRDETGRTRRTAKARRRQCGADIMVVI